MAHLIISTTLTVGSLWNNSGIHSSLHNCVCRRTRSRPLLFQRGDGKTVLLSVIINRQDRIARSFDFSFLLGIFDPVRFLDRGQHSQYYETIVLPTILIIINTDFGIRDKRSSSFIAEPLRKSTTAWRSQSL
jgi:hypothetical protein